jgi:hypothetical protein
MSTSIILQSKDDGDWGLHFARGGEKLAPSDIGQRVYSILSITMPIIYNGVVTLHLFKGTLARLWEMGTGLERTLLHFKIYNISMKMRRVIHPFQCPEFNLMYLIKSAIKSVNL